MITYLNMQVYISAPCFLPFVLCSPAGWPAGIWIKEKYISGFKSQIPKHTNQIKLKNQSQISKLGSGFGFILEPGSCDLELFIIILQ
jgi:hypothetical protein